MIRTTALFILLFLLLVNTSYAKGKGPNGIWPISERYMLVGDSSLPGLVVVDLAKGIATERLVIPKSHPVCVASCANCNFALVTSGLRGIWKINFKGPVTKLLNDSGSLGLSEARIEKLDFNQDKQTMIDSRQCLLSDDGKVGFFASLVDGTVFRMELGTKPRATPIWEDNVFYRYFTKLIRKVRKVDFDGPFGLNWGRAGNLLVAMHKQRVLRINTEGEEIANYDIKEAKCPGAELNPNLRSAVDDPTTPNNLIILATQPRSYDAVIWRLKYDESGHLGCSTVAGEIGTSSSSGWIDGSGKDIKFSRPHYLTLMPDSKPHRLLVTDMDNRALRIIDLHSDSSTTVMYNRDRRLTAVPEQHRRSKTPCSAQTLDVLSWATTPLGTRLCMLEPTEKRSDLSYNQAKKYCASRGARLCEPSELRQAAAQSVPIWTAAVCASCWHGKSGLSCEPVIKTRRIKANHQSKGFSQSWYSGNAIEVSSLLPDGPSTYCVANGINYKAAVRCCADEF